MFENLILKNYTATISEHTMQASSNSVDSKLLMPNYDPYINTGTQIGVQISKFKYIIYRNYMN